MFRGSNKKTGFLKFGLIAAFFLVLYYTQLLGLVNDWKEDPNYSHGFLIPFISIFLVWKKRSELSQVKSSADYAGLWVLLLGLMVYLIGSIGNETFLMRISMILVLIGLIDWNLGRDFMKGMAFPIAFLLLMIPLPYILYDAIAFPLQLWVSKMATNSLNLLQIPALREGNIIFLASTTLQVEEACSGIRSLISLLALTSIYAYLFQEGIVKRGLLIAAAIPIAVIVNSFRVTVTGVLAIFYGDKATQGFIHESLGWAVFIIAGLLVILLGKIISCAPVLFKRPNKKA